HHDDIDPVRRREFGDRPTGDAIEQMQALRWNAELLAEILQRVAMQAAELLDLAEIRQPAELRVSERRLVFESVGHVQRRITLHGKANGGLEHPRRKF